MLTNNRINKQEELEKEATFLSRIKKENHFSTPEKYFKVLPEVVSNKKLINKYLQLIIDKLSCRIFIPISASIVLFFVVFNFNSNSILTDLTSDQLSALIIEEDYLELEDYLVYEAYADLLEREGNKTTSTDDEYITYLLENNININSIIEEL
jgi:hypothetical protein